MTAALIAGDPKNGRGKPGLTTAVGIMKPVNAISLLLPTLAGLVGILLGGLLTGRNQRNQVHAERMIAAADDFATSATATLSAFYTALSRPDTSEEQMGRVERLIPEVRGRLTRVVLLFHPDSDTTTTAREAMAPLGCGARSLALLQQRRRRAGRGVSRHVGPL